MTDIELPPIAVSPYTDRILAAVRKQDCADPLFRILEDYARANVAHATEPMRAHRERLTLYVLDLEADRSGLIASCDSYRRRAERLAEALREKADKWDRIGDEHGVRQFTGNDHRLFANELRALLRDQEVGNG